MKKNLLLVLFLFSSAILFGQTKKVLLEEFTGAHCGQCPLGTQYVDSMLALHPNLITVALHAYAIPDAMFFAEIDTLSDTYAQGAPLGAVDRICTGMSSDYTAIFVNQWNTRIQQRLAVPAALMLDITPSWNSSTRNITAQVDINIVSNMPSGDYRLSIYVVEDSVTGTGSGYDQENFYDADASSPFYGMGNPIVGFVHRHVARAILPSAWGLQGLISSAPVTGQYFSHTFNYTLPVSYNENQVHLVAFVSEFTSVHTGDEVLNVTEERLLQGPAGVFSNASGNNTITVFPNPAATELRINNSEFRIESIEIYNVTGEKVFAEQGDGNQQAISIDVSSLESGIYFYKMIDRERKTHSGKMMVN